jgi:hypothetical protein
LWTNDYGFPFIIFCRYPTIYLGLLIYGPHGQLSSAYSISTSVMCKFYFKIHNDLILLSQNNCKQNIQLFFGSSSGFVINPQHGQHPSIWPKI